MSKPTTHSNDNTDHGTDASSLSDDELLARLADNDPEDLPLARDAERALTYDSEDDEDDEDEAVVSS
ncbi:hypothetical protein [Halobacterium sp. CBA1126]|uniref:hypothetical protein n=1 Tax=Halobacterium sp. CBA1126 TaxID=2668074 RepID=UPI0012FA3F26|nr:hypothetical protein [Halobacterium sp. CBA1126]MUV59949.1 hypothetical protein [Halobacterium sp. CBA1126]